MMSQTLEDKQNEILRLRASLGRWQHKSEQYVELLDRQVTPQVDLRQYKVIESKGSYKKPFEYNITEKTLVAKIKVLRQIGYTLVAPQFPELQEYFRNGAPITAADLFADAMNEIAVENDDRNGIDFLMDFWN